MGLRQGNSEASFVLPNSVPSGVEKREVRKGVTRMGRQIRVTAIKKEEPDIRLYVLALIALARQLQEEDERQAAGSRSGEPRSGEVMHERG